MSRSETETILISVLEQTSDGSAPRLHLDGTVKRLESAGYKDIITVDNSQSRGVLRRWFSVIFKSVLQMVRADTLILRFHPAGLPITLAARLLRRRIVILMQGVPSDALSSHSWLARFDRLYLLVVTQMLRGSHSIIVPTEGIAAWVNVTVNRQAEVLPNGISAVDASSLPKPLDSLPKDYVCFSGSLATWQGIDTMLEAVTRPEWPRDIPLVIVGDGQCAELVTNAQSSDVIYLGRKPSLEARSIIANAAASISVKSLTKSTEHGVSPFKVLESASVGTPLIVSRIDGQWENVRDYGSGIVIDPSSAVQLAEAVRRVVQDPDLRHRFSVNALRMADSNRWEAGAPILLDAVDPCRPGSRATDAMAPRRREC